MRHLRTGEGEGSDSLPLFFCAVSGLGMSVGQRSGGNWLESE